MGFELISNPILSLHLWIKFRFFCLIYIYIFLIIVRRKV